ncbi:hypothetical protein AGMMS49938_15500 [Fibrobacterales bacterium]|nr:hypothetical protein AGMMS49938_15500 [Fibrobacterales bacterium]
MLGVLKFTLTNIAESKKAKIVKNGAGVNAGVKMSNSQIKIFTSIQKNNNITQAEIAKKLKINESTVYRNIQKLKQMNIIERVGSDKDGVWQILI